MEKVGFSEPAAGEHFAGSHQSHGSSPKPEYISLAQELHILHRKPEMCTLHSNSTGNREGRFTLQMKTPSPRKIGKKSKGLSRSLSYKVGATRKLASSLSTLCDGQHSSLYI